MDILTFVIMNGLNDELVIHSETVAQFCSISICQLVIAANLWVKLLEMFVTLMSLKFALSVG